MSSSPPRDGTSAPRPNEQLWGLSGNALLTLGTHHLLLRLFNGTKFGPAHVVPISLGSFEVFTVIQDPSSRVHVFTFFGGAPRVTEFSTSTGRTWTKADLGAFPGINNLHGALDSHGRGLLAGYDGHTIRGLSVG
jgi:hypothetical protein